MEEEQPTFEEEYPVLEEEKPKIYNLPSIIIGSFLGGPLVTAYMMAENYKAFDRRDLVKITWLYTILITFFLSFTIIPLFIFHLNKYILKPLFPNLGAPVFNALLSNSHIINYFVSGAILASIAAIFLKKLQGKQIESYLEDNGNCFGISRAFFIGLLMLFIDFVILNILVVIFMVFFMVNG